jgi:hypothetical protein
LQFSGASFTHEIVLKHPILSTVFRHIALNDQMDQMNPANNSKRKTESPPPPQPTLSQLPTFQSIKDINDHELSKEFFSPNGCEVNISAYSNGTKEFFVQRVDNLQNYQEFCVKLQSMRVAFVQISTPVLGESYIAVFEGSIVYRIIVLERISSSVYVVQLIDTGDKRVVNAVQMYKLPDDLKIEPFTWKFSLSGIESINHLKMSEFNFYFIYLTRNKKLNLKLNKKAEKKGVFYRKKKKITTGNLQSCLF